MSAEVHKFEDGYVNEGVWRVGSLVVKRVSSKNPGVVVSDDERFQNEVRALALFGMLGLAPRLLAACPFGRLIFTSYLDGENALVMLRKMDEMKKWLGRAGQEEIERVEEELYFHRGKLLREWHQMKVVGGMTGKKYYEEVEKKVGEDLGMFADSDLLEKAGLERGRIERALREKALPRAMGVIEGYGCLVWTHGDWWTNNNIAEVEGGVVKSLKAHDPEFSQRTGGVPEEDLAQEFMWERKRRGGRVWKAFERGYGRNIDLPALAPFVLFKLLDYLEGGTVREWQVEGGKEDGFWTETLRNLAEVLVELEGQ